MNPPATRPPSSPMVKNSMFVFLSRGIDLVSGLFTTIIAARYLGVTLFGDFAYIRAVELILAQVIGFGTHRIIVRESSVHQERTSELIGGGLAITVVTGTAATLLALAVGWGCGLPTLSLASLAAAMAAQVIWRFTDTLRAAFIAYERMNLLLWVNMVVKVLTLGLFGAVYLLDLGFFGFFASLLLANLVGLAAAIALYLTRIPNTVWRLDFGRLTDLIRQSLPMAASAFFTMTYNHAGVFFLKALHTNAQVSFFQMPQRLLLLFSLYPASFILSIVPLISRLASDTTAHQELKTFIEVVWKYFLVCLLPFCALCLSPFLDEAIRLSVGPDFGEAAASCRILIWTVPLVLSNVLLGEILVSLRKQLFMLTSEAACLVTNLLLCALLVPGAGHLGASWALLISCLVLFACQYGLVWFHFRRLAFGWVSLKLMAATGAMAWIIAQGSPGVFLPLAGAIGAYLTTIFVTGLIRKDELKTLRTIVHTDVINQAGRTGRKTGNSPPPLNGT